MFVSVDLPLLLRLERCLSLGSWPFGSPADYGRV